MGTKYITEAISGYNASPPPDDNSQTEANKVKWSTTKTKLADPIKDQVANIDAKLLLMADVGPDAKSATYATVAGDHQKTIECDGTFTVTLLAVASAPTGYVVTLKNIGTGTITVDATGSETIDGSTSAISLVEQESITLQLNQAKTGYSSISSAGTEGALDGYTGTTADLNILDGITSTTEELNLNDGAVLKHKVIDIGDWNMDATLQASVAHGLTRANIRSVSGMVRNDADTAYFPITPGTFLTSTGEVGVYISSIDNPNIVITRSTGGPLDNANYDSTSYNRGWVTIWYTA